MFYIVLRCLLFFVCCFSSLFNSIALPVVSGVRQRYVYLMFVFNVVTIVRAPGMMNEYNCCGGAGALGSVTNWWLHNCRRR